MTNAPANHYTPAKRTLDQVKAFLAKCAKNSKDGGMSAAKLLINHGRLEDDAMAYAIEFVS